MPAGSNRKREREYEELKGEFKKEGRYKGREEEVAARIVNKQRARAGETKSARASSGTKRRRSDTRSPSRGTSRTSRARTTTRTSRSSGASRMRRSGMDRRESGSRARTKGSQDAGLPIRNYDEQPVTKIQQQLSRLSLADLRKLHTYEEKHKDRVTLIRRIERAQEEQRGSSSRGAGSRSHTRSGSRSRGAAGSRTSRAGARSRTSRTGMSRTGARNGSSSRSRIGSPNGRSPSPRSRSNGTASSHTTTDHETIRRWAEERGAGPVTVRGTGRDSEAGVLRLDFPGYSGKDRFEPISWDEFFQKFDEKRLQFLYQERTKGGQQSNFFKLIERGSSH